MSVEYREQFVWPMALRVIHWLLAVSVTLLLLTGWLLGSGMVVNEALYLLLRDTLHVPAGQLAGMALGGRLVLLAFDSGVAGWRALRPGAASAGAMLRFYVSWGRQKPPGYFAHDPLWMLVYPVWFVILGVQVIGGLALVYDRLRGMLHLPVDLLGQWHVAGSRLILLIAAMHVASVLLREIRGRGYEVSAMFHGYRIFRVDKSTDVGFKREVRIPLSGLGKRGPKDD